MTHTQDDGRSGGIQESLDLSAVALEQRVRIVCSQYLCELPMSVGLHRGVSSALHQLTKSGTPDPVNRRAWRLTKTFRDQESFMKIIDAVGRLYFHALRNLPGKRLGVKN